jgi:SAM-dependent methyltransferase
MDRRLRQVRKAYDLSVRQYRQGVDPFRGVPPEIRNSPFFQSVISGGSSSNSGTPDVREYLQPRPGMHFLDAGCAANLANFRLDQWPCTYYGIDISPALISAMKSYAASHKITVGGLYVAEISRLPFPGDFFDIASAVGVLEYCALRYIRRALRELQRVLRPGSRLVLDAPNRSHAYARDMARLEKFLGRPIYLHFRSKLENALAVSFYLDRVDDSGVMIKYHVRPRK